MSLKEEVETPCWLQLNRIYENRDSSYPQFSIVVKSLMSSQLHSPQMGNLIVITGHPTTSDSLSFLPGRFKSFLYHPLPIFFLLYFFVSFLSEKERPLPLLGLLPIHTA